jgi:hypothetical protein
MWCDVYIYMILYDLYDVVWFYVIIYVMWI